MGTNLIKINLDKTGEALVNRIADAVGGIARPWQTRRMAKAGVDAEIIQAEGQFKLTEVQRRGLERMVAEEGEQQQNIEAITYKAAEQVGENAKPEEMEKDWITNFFHHSRRVSDEEMQQLWANVLAGEAQRPGRFSRRTVDLIASLDKRDAELFKTLCTFCWNMPGPTLLIYDITVAPYFEAGINFESLSHLESIGLITFSGTSDIALPDLSGILPTAYYDSVVILEFPSDKKTSLPLGKAMFTRAGAELQAICGAERSDEFFQFVLSRWNQNASFTFWSPLPS